MYILYMYAVLSQGIQSFIFIVFFSNVIFNEKNCYKVIWGKVNYKIRGHYVDDVVDIPYGTT